MLLHSPIVEIIRFSQFVVYIDTFGRVCGLPFTSWTWVTKVTPQVFIKRKK